MSKGPDSFVSDRIGGGGSPVSTGRAIGNTNTLCFGGRKTVRSLQRTCLTSGNQAWYLYGQRQTAADAFEVTFDATQTGLRL